LLAQILQSFWIFNTLPCNPRATIPHILNTSQTPQIALCGLIFFLVLGYRFSIRLSQILSERLTLWKNVAHFLLAPLSFRLGMLDAWLYIHTGSLTSCYYSVTLCYNKLVLFVAMPTQVINLFSSPHGVIEEKRTNLLHS